MSLYDSQAPICPICQVLLRPGELQEHMETEIERLANICVSLLSPFDTVNKQVEVAVIVDASAELPACLAPAAPLLKVLKWRMKRGDEDSSPDSSWTSFSCSSRPLRGISTEPSRLMRPTLGFSTFGAPGPPSSLSKLSLFTKQEPLTQGGSSYSRNPQGEVNLTPLF
ncbi:unnamed protein product [Tetraodon nigroviridis]|uniref:(spotted green pufferfish) hypothetical protein n=1 Tax=Tetraodon nigroviridis TaxID=99883 RepID=Q4SNP6_TETNG|nr:unnamed protein product [Tetraodon nigroviridis]